MPRAFAAGDGLAQLAYVDYQPPGASAAPAILLVHGLASSGAQFAADGLRFARKGYRVIVPDLRGHGLSRVTGRASKREAAIPALAADVLAMLDHAGVDQVHWVGNSLGGILALHLIGTPAIARLTTLALFGTCPSIDLPAGIEMALPIALLPGHRVTGWITALVTTPNPEGRAAIAQAVSQMHPAFARAIISHVRNYDLSANALAFERPLLILRGGRDHAVNMRLTRDLPGLAGRPNVRLVELPAAGHCANLDAPHTVARALLDHWALAQAA